MAFSFTTTPATAALAVIPTNFDLSAYTLTVQVSATADFASVQAIGTATYLGGRITLNLTSAQVDAIGTAYYRVKADRTGPTVSFFVTSGRIVNTAGAKVAPSTGDVTAEGYLADAGSSVTAVAGSAGSGSLNILVLNTNDVVPNGTKAGTLIVRTTGVAPPVSLPTALTLSAIAGNATVQLSLSGGIGSGVTYALYRSATVTGTPIATGFPYVDGGRTNGTAISYVATATNATGTVTSNVITVTPSAPVDSSVRPVFITSSIVTNRATSAATLTLTKPSGVVDGDLLVAFLHNQNGTTAQPVLPSGWSYGINISDASSQRSVYIAYLAVPSASALTATSWTFPFANGAGRCVGAVARMTGADLTTPVGGISITPSVVGNGIQAPAFNTNKNGCLTLVMFNYQATSPNQPIPSNISEGSIVLEIPSVDDTAVTRSTLGIAITSPTLTSQAAVTATPASSVANRSMSILAVRPA